MNAGDSQKLFRIAVATADLDEFRAIAKAAEPLKAIGQVALEATSLAGRRQFDLPEGGCPWHDYLCELPTIYCFFPHPKLAPFIDADFVKANRSLLDAKLEILREFGYQASFYGPEPSFWPEAFFREYPHLRGPRCDHPRRSTKEEFAPCIDSDEVLEMYQWMAAEFKRNVPELASLAFHVNDCGSGACWANALYPGVNGPSWCANNDPGIRIRKFLEAFHRGAAEAGGTVKLSMSGNFWGNEVYSIMPNLPANSYLDNWASDAKTVYDMGQNAPVRGVLDPLALLTAIDAACDPEINEVRIGLYGHYHRGVELTSSVEQIVSLITDCLDGGTGSLRRRLALLGEYCEKWAGADLADELFDALVQLN